VDDESWQKMDRSHYDRIDVKEVKQDGKESKVQKSLHTGTSTM